MENNLEGLSIYALAGSLRSDSYNHRLLRAAGTVVPEGMNMTLHDSIADIPLFDEDLEAETNGGPEAVRKLRKAIAAADGLLIATPEYNQSLPGVLKNTIDWLSRAPAGENPVLEGKPVAIVGATPGPWGTRLAQAQLRQALAATGSPVLPQPMLFVRDVANALDPATGHFDATTMIRLGDVMSAFQRWVGMLRVAGIAA